MTPHRARTLAGGSFAVSALLCAGAAVVLEGTTVAGRVPASEVVR